MLTGMVMKAAVAFANSRIAEIPKHEVGGSQGCANRVERKGMGLYKRAPIVAVWSPSHVRQDVLSRHTRRGQIKES